MNSFLTEEWLEAAKDALAGLPERVGVDADIQYVVSGAPAGKIQVRLAIRSGQVVELGAGKHDDAGCTVSLSYPDAMALFAGELRPEVAFMSGQVKVEGDHRIWLLDLRPLRADAGPALGALREATSS